MKMDRQLWNETKFFPFRDNILNKIIIIKKNFEYGAQITVVAYELQIYVTLTAFHDS